MNDSSARQDGLAVVGVFLALVALLGAVFSVGLAVRANDEDDGTGVAAGPTQVEVTLTEFAIEPADITAPQGSTLLLTNDGSATHNFAVDGTDLVTPDFGSGESSTLDLAGLAPGEYPVSCHIAGHADAGMTGTLRITESGGATQAASGDHEGGGGDAATMSWEEMDKVMAERAHAFPQETAGAGAQELAPTVLADGTKQFTLTASVFDWETEAGKVVEAWGYNEQVPGPTIRVGVGEKIRIVVKNELPESTALHSHGMTLPNAMDGVPDITQEPIHPGESYAYEWTTVEPMVGMYHSHHNAAKQVSNGMLGAFYVGEMPLPAGTPTPVIDEPMILNDAGTIGLTLNGKSFPATKPYVVKQGDWVKVDYMNEGLQVHPMHLHGMPQLVIAKDGYPLATPSREDTVLVAPGERVSVLFQATEKGVWAWHCHILTHAEREDGMFGMVTALIVE